MVSAIIKGNQNTTKLINSLKTAAKQYKVLSKEEEEELIKTYKDDREKLNNLLFMHNIRLVFNVAKKYMSKTDDFDAMVQDGMLGLAIAADRFEIERGVKFITYAMPWILKKIKERFYLKENKITKCSTSLNAPAPGCSKINDGADADLENYVNDMIDPSVYTIKSVKSQLSSMEQASICRDLYQSLEDDTSLSATDKSIFIDMFYNREKSRDIQRKYNVTNHDMSAIKNHVLSLMRKKLEMKYDVHSFSDIYDA